MKIWLINPYGPLPTEEWRDYRYTIFATALSEENHEITWWTSNFSHHFKRFRSKGWTNIKISDNFTIRLVPTTSYKKNIGFRRIFRDWIFAFRTYQDCKKNEKPDLIIFSENPLCFGFAGSKLAIYFKVPSITDQMDLWPELFEKSFPNYLQSIVHKLFKPLYLARINVNKNLAGFISLAKPYLEIPVNEVTSLRDKPCEIIYNGIDVNKFRIDMKSNMSNNLNIPTKANHEIWAIFAGSLGPSYDIPTLLDTAKLLHNNYIKIIIAGDGPYRKSLESFVVNQPKEYQNVYYLGFLSSKNLAFLYSKCDIGLAAYTKNSNVEMPDKFYDFTAAGLAIINSLSGEVSTWISNQSLGYNYIPGDKYDLLQKINLLVSNKPLLTEIKKNSFEIAQKFDQKKQMSKLITIVNDVTNYSRD